MKKERVLVFSTILLLGLILDNGIFAQPNLEWEKSYGGSGWERAWCIQQTTDAGYIVVGSSTSSDGDVESNNGGTDYWILKLNAAGNLERKKNYGGAELDMAWSVQQTTDGGYIIVGSSKSNSNVVEKNGLSTWVLKLDMTGNLEWEKHYGKAGVYVGTSIQQTTDGGYVITGHAPSDDGDAGRNIGEADYWILKLNKAGEIEWEKKHGGSGVDMAASIQQTKEGGYIIAGYARSNNGYLKESNGKHDYWILKLDTTGDIEWKKNYGGSGVDMATSIQQTTDGGYIVVGNTRSDDRDVGSNKGGFDCWVLKLDTAGNLEWKKSYGGVVNDEAYSIQQTVDGGYIMAGLSLSNAYNEKSNRGFDYWILKLDTIGNLEWQQNYGGSDWERAEAIQQTTDGGYILAGSSKSNDGDASKNNGGFDYWIVKLTAEN